MLKKNLLLFMLCSFCFGCTLLSSSNENTVTTLKELANKSRELNNRALGQGLNQVDKKLSRKVSANDNKSFEIYDSFESAKKRYEELPYNIAHKSKILDKEKYAKEYKKINIIRDHVLRRFIYKYPQISKLIGNNKPIMLINDDPNFGGFVFKKPFFITVHHGVFKVKDKNTGKEKDVEDSVLFYLLAHEMVHLFLQRDFFEFDNNFMGSFFYDISKYKNKNIELKNLKIDNDLNIVMKDWVSYASVVGEHSSHLYKSVPVSHSYSGVQFLHFMIYMATENSCKKFIKEHEMLSSWGKTTVDSNGGPREFTTNMGELDSQDVKEFVLSLQVDLKKCLPKKINYHAEFLNYKKNIGIDRESYKNISSHNFKYQISGATEQPRVKKFDDEINLLFDKYPAGEAFLKVFELARQKMRVIERVVNIKNIRHYTKEDHADEIMIKIMNSFEMTAQDFFLALPDVYLCEKSPKKEPYSPLTKMHHNQCWRWWRSYNM